MKCDKVDCPYNTNGVCRIQNVECPVRDKKLAGDEVCHEAEI